MKATLRRILVAGVLFFATSGAAWACGVEGRVVCEGTTDGVANVTVRVTDGLGFEATVTTDADGWFNHWVPGLGSYAVSLDLSTAGGTGVVELPAVLVTEAVQLGTTGTVPVVVPGCGPELKCWLTGGGAKFSPVTGGYVAEHGPKVSLGGNVNPSCSPDPGEGGQWNHVDHALKLHFLGTSIVVDRCGNVAGIPPGSTSPVTPYNFIEFSGIGVLKGIGGNRIAPRDVCFEARAEDRNEPGSSGQRDGALIDRYFIRVTDCAGATLLVLEANAGAGDPIAITDGNLQLHVSSCP